ncbi:hypothetical protein Q0M94_25875 (plasmid) [Deinococcus radiomollis]|uniref:hypothetical protein n=1 Tax=Deinococcus radiomollis TaxID=468916 RepID=UPI003892A38B
MLMLTGQAADPGRARLFAAGSVPLLATDWRALMEMHWQPAHPASFPGRYAAYSIADHTDGLLYVIFTTPGVLAVSLEAADLHSNWSVVERTELPVSLAIWHALLPDGIWRAR